MSSILSEHGIRSPLAELGWTKAMVRDAARALDIPIWDAPAAPCLASRVEYGLAVTGVVHPARILTNSGARPGDALVLTKPLGTGVLINANRSGNLSYRALLAILPTVAGLNRKALEGSARFEVHACTDITGFGVLGHSLEMAKGSGVRIHLSFRDLPFYPNAQAMYRRGETTGSNAERPEWRGR